MSQPKRPKNGSRRQPRFAGNDRVNGEYSVNDSKVFLDPIVILLERRCECTHEPGCTSAQQFRESIATAANASSKTAESTCRRSSSDGIVTALKKIIPL